MYSGDISTLTDPLVAMQNLSPKTSAPEKAQHEPHCSWFLILPMQFGHCCLASKLLGTAPTFFGLYLGTWKVSLTGKKVPNIPLTCSKVLPSNFLWAFAFQLDFGWELILLIMSMSLIKVAQVATVARSAMSTATVIALMLMMI